MAKKPKKPKTPGLTAEEFESVGRDPRVAAIWPRLSRKQRQKIIQRAHARGLTVAGFLSGAPDALAERMPGAIRAQAERTITDAYKPAEAELDQRDTRTRALDAKRQNDNAHYLQWLQDRSAEQRVDAQRADQLLADRQRQIQEDTARAYEGMRGQIVEAVGQQEGVVSNVGTAAGANVTPEAQRAVELVAAERDATARASGTAQKHAAGLAANNFAIHAAAEARRHADTWGELAKVGDERQKLVLQKGADTAKEIARLLDQEILKAQSNREFEVAVQKLNLDAQEEANDQRNADRQFGLEQNKFRQSVREWRHQVRVDRAKLGIDRAGLRQDQAQFEAQLEVDWYNARNKDRSGSRNGDQDIKDTNQFAFDTAYASLVTATREVPRRVRGKVVRKTVRFDEKYVRANRALAVNLLVSQLGVNRKVAQAAVEAYLRSGGNSSDPGDFARWVRASRGRTPAASAGSRGRPD